MGKTYTNIDDSIRNFIAAQHGFFVASAPLSPDGHVNNSPKGMGTFRILGDRTVAYLDLTGSGIEIVSHVKENGRVTIMFCSFQGPPKILRLYGHGRIVEPDATEFEGLSKQFPDHAGTRAIVLVEISMIADSCGFSLPQLTYEAERKQLTAWADNKGSEGLRKYRSENNRTSIDGLAGLETL